MGKGKKKEVYSHEQNFFHMQTMTIKRNSLSGYLDSNQGPPAPKAGALTGLRYTPKIRATNGTRTRNIYHGRVAFYQLNYCRILRKLGDSNPRAISDLLV